MISGVNVNETRKYVLPWDKDNPTVWYIGIIPASITAMLVDKVKDDYFAAMLLIVRMGLKGWENFEIDGKPAEFRTVHEKVYGIEADMVEKSLIDAIPLQALTEIAKEIQNQIVLSQKESKN